MQNIADARHRPLQKRAHRTLTEQPWRGTQNEHLGVPIERALSDTPDLLDLYR
jgi:hypothetical protein